MRARDKAFPLLKAMSKSAMGLSCSAYLLSAGVALATTNELPPPKIGAPTLRIHGSNTIGSELSPALVTDFLKEQHYDQVQIKTGTNPLEHTVTATRESDGRQVQIDLTAHGSATGFADLNNNLTDIAAASRRINDSEVQEMARLGNLKSAEGEHVIGLDGVAVIINKQNPINSLSTEQLAGLFSGDIQDWSKINGKPGKVDIYSRDSKSGTWETFNELILKSNSKTLSKDANLFEDSELLSKKVSEDPNGIGFIGLPYVLNAKAVAVSDGGYSAIFPTVQSIATEDYPLARRLFFYAPTINKNPWADALIKFSLTPEGQAIVTRIGFIGQEPQPFKVTPTGEMPAKYKELAENAERLSVNFRFADGGAELDNKAKRDLQRVVSYAKAHDVKHLALVGFSDDSVTPERASVLSKLRVLAVRRELAKAGVITTDVQSFGNARPVSSSEAPREKRQRNRRVEVWVYPNSESGEQDKASTTATSTSTDTSTSKHS